MDRIWNNKKDVLVIQQNVVRNEDNVLHFCADELRLRKIMPISWIFKADFCIRIISKVLDNIMRILYLKMFLLYDVSYITTIIKICRPLRVTESSNWPTENTY